jgi:predicted permease
MRWTSRRWLILRSLLRSLFFGGRVERDLDDELRFHLQTVTDRYLASGLSPADAHAAARRDLGGLEQRKDECRDVRRTARLEQLGRDARFALRMLRRNPGFAVLGVMIMALGIGANTAVFSVVYTVLLKPLPFQDADRIVTLRNAARGGPVAAGSGGLGNQISAPNFWDWHAQASTFEAMAYYSTRATVTMAGTTAEFAEVTTVTPEFFRVFAVNPTVGRGFAPEEEQRGGAPAVLVSAAYARDHFGEVTRAVGQTLRVLGRTTPIVGVMPASFDFPRHTDIWFPDLPLNSFGLRTRTANNYLAIGKLKSGVTLTQAQAEMVTIAARLEQQYPQVNEGRSIALTRLQEQMVGDVKPMLYLMLGAVGLVLLIACANMATLLLAKATARTQEIAVRAALGASRGRIIQQLLVEGLVLALLSGVAGVVIAIWGTRALVALAPGDVPRLAETGIDAYVLAFTAGVCLLVSILFSLPPALQASRIDVGDPLKGGAARSVVGDRAGRVREGLVIAEIALTLMLLAGGGLLIRSLIALQQVTMGFNPEQVAVMRTTMPGGSNRARDLAFFADVMREIARLPGVTAVGAAMAPPGSLDADSGYYIDHLPEEITMKNGREAVMNIVSPGMFAALGIPLTKGRDFRDSDTREAPGAAIINEALAREAFPGQDPIGRTIFCLFDNKEPSTIIGVVGDVHQRGPAKAATSECFMTYTQHPFNGNTLNIMARTSLPTDALIEPLRRIARTQSPEAAVRFTTMTALTDEHYAAPRFRALLLGLFGVIALCLALAGVYGVMAFIVSQRTSEMGLRMALGATPSDVLRLVFSRGVRLAAIGLVIGVIGAVGATRLLSGQLFGVTPNDVMTYTAAIALLGVMSLVAVYIPARRSTRIDPLTALRQE